MSAAPKALALPVIGSVYRNATVLDARYLNPSKTAFFVVSKGSVWKFKGSAIVNAANVWGLGGGGIDGVITRMGGPKMADERKALWEFKCDDKMSGFYGDEIRIKEGGWVITSWGLTEWWAKAMKAGRQTSADMEPTSDLVCGAVIHTVGPQFNRPRDENEEEMAWKLGILKSWYTNSLWLLDTVAGDEQGKKLLMHHFVAPDIASDWGEGSSSWSWEWMKLSEEETNVSLGFALVSAGIFRGEMSVKEVLGHGVDAVKKYFEGNEASAVNEVHLVGFTGDECEWLSELVKEKFEEIAEGAIWQWAWDEAK